MQDIKGWGEGKNQKPERKERKGSVTEQSDRKVDRAVARITFRILGKKQTQGGKTGSTTETRSGKRGAFKRGPDTGGKIPGFREGEGSSNLAKKRGLRLANEGMKEKGREGQRGKRLWDFEKKVWEKKGTEKREVRNRLLRGGPL